MSLAKKKAPGAAATASEGMTGTINEEGTESVMNNTIPTTAPSTMTPEQADFAARFAHYDVVVRVSAKTTCGPEQNGDGSWFFRAAAIKISPRAKQITVIAAEGAYTENVDAFRAAADDFRSGRAWSRIFDKLQPVKYSGSDEEWFRTDWLGWTSPDEWLEGGGFRVAACRDERCTATWHEYDDTTDLGTPNVVHTADIIEHPAGRYTVSMSRMTAGAWKIDVELHGFELSVFDARSLSNDINWLSVECEKLNATEAVAA